MTSRLLSKKWPPILKSKNSPQTKIKSFDQKFLKVSGGTGGNGMMMFRRERDQPRMGPDGGNGGNGGSIYFVGNSKLSNLNHLKNEYIGKSGQDGVRHKYHSKNIKPEYIELPLGTLILNETTNEVSVMQTSGTKILAAKGGFGGYVNAHFKTPESSVPFLCVPSSELRPPDEYEYNLQCIGLNQVNIYGYKGAGKSSLLQYLTNVKGQTVDRFYNKNELKYDSITDLNSTFPGYIYEPEELNEGPVSGNYTRLNDQYGILVRIGDYPDFDLNVKDRINLIRRTSLFSHKNLIIVDGSDSMAADKLENILDKLTTLAINRSLILINKQADYADEIMEFRNLNYPDLDILILPFDFEKLYHILDQYFLNLVKSIKSNKNNIKKGRLISGL